VEVNEVPESAEPQNDLPLEASMPEAVPLESIVCTEELHRRPGRSPDFEKENRALVALVTALCDSTSTIFQTLAETILDMTQCDSSGLSLLTPDGGKRFYWPAIAGMWAPHVGGGTPRNFGPCGDVLDRNCTMLFRRFERRYPYLMPVVPAAEECLLVPFYMNGNAVGTIWGIMHSDRRKFDSEDERIMNSLGQFASVAYRTVASIDNLKVQITAREKAEAELLERATGLEATVRRLIDANLMGIFTWNLEGRIVEANETFRKMMQWDREDVGSAGMRWTDLTPEEWRARDELAVEDLKATGTMQPYEKEYFRKDGSRVPVLVGAALFEEGGNDGVAFALDLSEQKHAEEAVRRVEEQARAIVDSALDAVVAMDADGKITNWNKQAEEIFGWTRAEALGRRMSETIIPAQYRLSHEQGLEQFFKTSQGPLLNRRIEIHALRRDGTEFPVELTITPLKSGDSWTFSSFIRDISERKRAEQKLRESELNLRNTQAELAHVARVMTMGELTASIAHEVNQPLAAIVASGDSCSAWLSNDPPNLDKARAAASRMIQAATQASEIVQRLRALFKKTTSITASVDMNAVIEDTISLVHHETERNKIFLRTELDPGVPAVSGDRVQLQQVILNLAMNGIEAISDLDTEPRRLMIRSALSNTRELLVSVEDTGLGIEEEHADRLFAPFFTTKPEGIGMGLPICRSIIEAHGGRLWVDKKEPRGAAFRFTLPVKAPSE
jgi:PAS domain S-box-containing protein